MRCYCCDHETTVARKVKLRGSADYTPEQGGPQSSAYRSYVNEMTYRWAFICNACYRSLDNEMGVGEIGAKMFNLAGASRGDEAAVVDQAKYDAFQRKQIEDLGIQADD